MGKLTDIRVQPDGKKTNTQMVLAKRNGERQYIGLVSVDEEGVVILFQHLMSSSSETCIASLNFWKTIDAC